MPHGKARELIPAPADQVFALLHDYSRRLTWDTLLSQAYLTDGFTIRPATCPAPGFHFANNEN